MASRNRKKSGGGGGGDQKNVTMKFGTRGKRSECKFNVILRLGKFVLPDQQIMFRLGTTDNPNQEWLSDPANPGKRYELVTNVEGEKESQTFDFSTDQFKGYTQLTAVYWRNADPAQGEYTQTILLPLLETTDAAKTKAPDKPRLKVDAEGDTIVAKAFKALIAMETFDGKFNPSSDEVEATIITGEKVTFFDPKTGAVLSAKTTSYEFKTNPDGRFRLGVNLLGRFEVKLELYHKASRQKKILTLVYKQ